MLMKLGIDFERIYVVASIYVEEFLLSSSLSSFDLSNERSKFW